MHGDVVYCVAMLCNYRRPLVPVPVNAGGCNVGEEEPQAGGLSDDELNEDALEEAIDAEAEADVDE